MNIIQFGKSERVRIAASRLSSALADRSGDLILLPIPTTRDGTHITGCDVALSSALDGVGQGTVVVGYAIPASLCDRLSGNGALVLDAAHDEDFLASNAAITADGTLGRILTESRRAPRDLSVGIIGYGRIGSRLMSRLMFLGARVSVITTRQSVRLSLGESGVDCRDGDDPDRFSGLDIIVNTAPAETVSESEMAEMSRGGVWVIDLASGKYLSDSPALTKLPSVPDMMYPESAGRLYADLALRALDGEITPKT